MCSLQTCVWNQSKVARTNMLSRSDTAAHELEHSTSTNDMSFQYMDIKQKWLPAFKKKSEMTASIQTNKQKHTHTHKKRFKPNFY